MKRSRCVLGVVGALVAMSVVSVQGRASADGVPEAARPAATNPAPAVVPALQQWTGGRGEQHLTPRSRVVLAPSDHGALRKVASQLVSDLKDFTGWRLRQVTGRSRPGDIVLDLDPDAAVGPDTALAHDEGYSLRVTDRTVITARTSKAVFWGTRSLLQMLAVQGRGDATVPVGSAVDWPNYAVRGLMLDLGRRWFGEKYIRDLTRYLSWFKMNTFQLHLNDNAITAPDGDWSKAYSAFRLKSDNPKFAGLAATDGSFTHAEWEQLEGVASDHFVNILPEFDAPAHSRAFVKFKPEIGLDGGDSDTLDLSKPEATEFMKSVFKEFTPWFHSKTVSMGADEYPTDLASEYQKYFNTMAAYIRSLGKKPAAWGSLSQMAPDSRAGYDHGVTIDSWNNSWYGPQQATKDGFDFINSNDANLYLVPYADYYHGQGLDAQWLYENWTPNVFSGDQTVPADDPHLLGAMPAVWNDLTDLDYGAADVQKMLEPSLGVLAQKMWRGVEPGQTYDQFKVVNGNVAVAPGTEDLQTDLPTGDKLTSLTVDTPDGLVPGTSGTVSATVTNTGTRPLVRARTTLRIEGVDVSAGPGGPSVIAPGRSATWSWKVSVPATFTKSSATGTIVETADRGGVRASRTAPVTLSTPRSLHYLFSQAYDGPSYKRVTREISVPAGGGSLSFWTDYATEQDWDYLFVEARTSGQDDWTTLPDANGHTSTTPGDSCTNGWVSLHPQLAHYQTYDADTSSCTSTGSTGEWNAATGSSGGWVQWKVDLSKWAGKKVEVSFAYASDWGTNGAGVFLDDITEPDGATATFEDGGLDGWTVPGAPTGDPANPNDFVATTASENPAP